MLAVGDRAPDFTALDQTGAATTLADLLRSGRLVLYFYPKDFTPGCTKEACDFRDADARLTHRGVRVAGVSHDGVDSHARFDAQHRLGFTLLSDPERRIAKAFGAVQLLGLFSKRVTFVIDRDKTILGVFHHEVAIGKHLAGVEALLARLEERPEP